VLPLPHPNPWDIFFTQRASVDNITTISASGYNIAADEVAICADKFA
jgi:hypothetical protein